MEHRKGKRLPLNIDTEVWLGNIYRGKFNSRDISYGGLFLEQGSGVLKKGDFIMIRIKDLHLDSDNEIIMRAIVIHESTKGVGLMWADENTVFFNILGSLVKKAA